MRYKRKREKEKELGFSISLLTRKEWKKKKKWGKHNPISKVHPTILPLMQLLQTRWLFTWPQLSSYHSTKIFFLLLLFFFFLFGFAFVLVFRLFSTPTVSRSPFLVPVLFTLRLFHFSFLRSISRRTSKTLTDLLINYRIK